MILINPSFDPGFKGEAPTRLPLGFHKRLPDYNPTPLHSLSRLAGQLGVERVYVKDESLRLGLPSFKVLGASWATYRALLDRYPALPREWESVDDIAKGLRSCHAPVLYAATDGNHGRAVARVAKMFGLRARIFVPQRTVEARVAAIQHEGAEVTIVNGTYNETVAQAARHAGQERGLLIQDSGWNGYEIIPRYVIEGYSTMFREIDDSLAFMNEPGPTHILVQIGVGSLADAAVRHYCAEDAATVIIGVEPDSAACALESVRAGRMVKIPGPHTSIMAGMNCDSPSLVSFQALLKGIQYYVSISDDRAREAMRALSRNNIISGETGAAGMGALLELFSDKHRLLREQMGMQRVSRILLISTEGATDPQSYGTIVQS